MVLLVSPVTYTHLPSGLTATPSGSVPVTSAAIVEPSRVATIDAVPASSFDTANHFPSGESAIPSGSVPAL